MENQDIRKTTPSRLVVYCTAWCPDCRRTLALLHKFQINFLEIDIGKKLDDFLFVEKLTGRINVPTLVFPDGTIMVEPADEFLLLKLGVDQHD